MSLSYVNDPTASNRRFVTEILHQIRKNEIMCLRIHLQETSKIFLEHVSKLFQSIIVCY